MPCLPPSLLSKDGAIFVSATAKRVFKSSDGVIAGEPVNQPVLRDAAFTKTVALPSDRSKTVYTSFPVRLGLLVQSAYANWPAPLPREVPEIKMFLT